MPEGYHPHTSVDTNIYILSIKPDGKGGGIWDYRLKQTHPNSTGMFIFPISVPMPLKGLIAYLEAPKFQSLFCII